MFTSQLFPLSTIENFAHITLGSQLWQVSHPKAVLSHQGFQYSNPRPFQQQRH